ncbi:hypothetical protein Cgig2_021556 [Carnegiea gigantea]|uniref:Aminotransferase-like plant mobile domain-containing protein n=1 Tax=Carnegiea gigantea TaxID=171969 RepID=A0A9Q1KAS4_9CARY|nr:hypothetical protein Cgig2_021556 [Carnegiea gigantea]
MGRVVVEGDIEEVEAIDPDSREATKVAQLWTAGARLVRDQGPRKGSVIDEDWEVSSGSEFLPSKEGASTEDSVLLVDDSGEDVRVFGSDGDDAIDADADSGDGSGKGKSRKRRRQPIMEGRRSRRKAAGDGFMFDKDRRGVRATVPVSVRGRCTLEKIYKFNKTLETHQREAIEGMILKPILEYRPFSMQRESTTALVKAWVPRRKAFRLTGRFVSFSVYDVAFFTGLPVTGKRVEFREDDFSMTKLARSYIKVMKKLLDANREPEKLGLWLSLYAWVVMSGVMFPRTPYGTAWSVQAYMEDVRRLRKYAWAKAMWRIFMEAAEEMQSKLEGPVSDFQAWFYEHYRELEARLNMCEAHSEHPDARRQPGSIHSESGLETLARAGTELQEGTEHDSSELKGGEDNATFPTIGHIPGDSSEGHNMTTRTTDAVAPPGVCVDKWQAPQSTDILHLTLCYMSSIY